MLNGKVNNTKSSETKNSNQNSKQRNGGIGGTNENSTQSSNGNGVAKHGVNLNASPFNLEKPAQKSVVIAYILWLFGGIFGLHHIYLHRDRHAFVWWCTLGGYFGIGWLSEIFSIPKLVRDANEDPEFVKQFIEKLKLNRKPPFSMNRFVGAIMIGYLWGQVVMVAIPQDDLLGISWNILHWVIPLFMALGVWTVGNIGREQGVLWHCLLASYAIYPIRYWVYDETYWFTGTVFVAALVFDGFSKRWQTQPPKREKKIKRAMILSAAVCIYLSLWGCYFVFNGKITDSDGDVVPVHEAIRNFLKSPWWTDLKRTFAETWRHARHLGWYETWRQIVENMDVDGEINGYKVLGVSATASQSEITTQWRKLSREYHPDKVKDETQRRAAQEKFMEIQQAYEILSNIKNKRRQKNKKFNDEM